MSVNAWMSADEPGTVLHDAGVARVTHNLKVVVGRKVVAHLLCLLNVDVLALAVLALVGMVPDEDARDARELPHVLLQVRQELRVMHRGGSASVRAWWQWCGACFAAGYLGDDVVQRASVDHREEIDCEHEARGERLLGTGGRVVLELD